MPRLRIQSDFARFSDTKSPQGVLAVAVAPRSIGGGDAVWTDDVVVSFLSDPGNAGSLVRTALAAGVPRLIFVPTEHGCVHPLHPRVVRASAGALFRCQVKLAADAKELRQLLPTHRFVAAEARGGTNLYATESARLLQSPLALLVGNEQHGLSESAKKLVSEVRVASAERTTSYWFC